MNTRELAAEQASPDAAAPATGGQAPPDAAAPAAGGQAPPDAAPPAAGGGWRGALASGGLWGYRRVRNYAGTLTALLALCIYLGISQPVFLTKANIFNILTGNADLMLTSIGLTFVVLSAGFDLSVGAMSAAAGLAAYEAINAGLPAELAVVLALLLGALIGGAVNGTLIGVFKLNFFVVTLGMMSLIAGAVDVITNGQTETIQGSSFFAGIGNAEALGVPVPIWICLGALILAAFVLHHTPFGRAVFAVGGNPEAARLAGINVTLVRISVYAIAGFGAALAGVIDASRLASASPSAGETLMLTAAAAVLLGGTSFFGGIGSIGGTLVGVLMIAVLQNGLGLLGVSAFWEGVVTGGVLIAAIAVGRLQSKEQA